MQTFPISLLSSRSSLCVFFVLCVSPCVVVFVVFIATAAEPVACLGQIKGLELESWEQH